MVSSLCILLSVIIQDGKTVKSSENFEIKADIFSELQGINAVLTITLLLLFCMKTKIHSTLMITSEKLEVFSEGFCNCNLCQFSEIYVMSFFIIICCQRLL